MYFHFLQILLEKASGDILLCLKDNKKPSVVNSIINSVGILRYRDTGNIFYF